MYENEDGITESEVVESLRALLCGEPLEDTPLDGCRTKTYADAGYLTRDEGFVIRTPDGSVFQITVRQER